MSAEPSRRWSPSPAIQASLWLHGLAAVGFVLAPQRWRWFAGAVLANHAALGVLGMPPRSTLLGPNLSRLPPAPPGARPRIALTFDDGPDPGVTPAVLALLERHGATASFFCIGRQAVAHPDLVRLALGHGHSIENHSDTHPNRFALMGIGALRREVAGGQQRLIDAVADGPVPRFFRAPLGLRSPLLDPVLAQTGLRLVGWTRRGYDTVASAGAVLRRLTGGLADGDILVLHDGFAGRPGGNPAVLAVLPHVLAAAASAELAVMSLPRALGEA